MNGPRRYLTRMLIFLAAVILVGSVLLPKLISAFNANPALNGLIVGVALLGIFYIFRQVVVLIKEAAWLENFRSGMPETSSQSTPRLLAPMAAMLGERKGRFSLSAISARSLLDAIADRLDESRDLSRYLIGLLIFLGLLGTFWGLLETITSVAGVIGGLTSGGGEAVSLLSKLKAGLQAPLSGMGTAFSSSLFGLAGSLVLGFLELQAGQAQNRFYNELEDWLAGQTRLSSGSTFGGEGEQGVPAYVQALLEQTADSLENLQRTLIKGEEAGVSTNTNIAALTDKLSTLSDQMRTEQNLMLKLAETQLELKPVLIRLAEGSPRAEMGMDDATRGNIRNIEIHLARMLEEMATGRTEMVSEIRSELRVLSRTLAAISEKATR